MFEPGNQQSPNENYEIDPNVCARVQNITAQNNDPESIEKFHELIIGGKRQITINGRTVHAHGPAGLTFRNTMIRRPLFRYRKSVPPVSALTKNTRTFTTVARPLPYGVGFLSFSMPVSYPPVFGSR